MPNSGLPPRTGNGRLPTAPMDAERVIGLLDGLNTAGCRAWVHGGWGVDALLGEQTRSHDDLDLIVVVNEWPKVLRVLARFGYTVVEGGMPRNTVLLDKLGHQVDLHPARIDDSGDAVYTGEHDVWRVPAAALRFRGAIAGVEVACLSPEIEAGSHTGYTPDGDDRADVAALVAKFGLSPPEGY